MSSPPSTSPELLEEPTVVVFGRFRLLERIGQGGMGEVWRAETLQPGRVVQRAAVKRLRPEFAESKDFLSRFVAEARITSRLEHPNIVRMLAYDETPEPYIALEYVDGANVARLFQRCAEAGLRVPPAAAMYIVAVAARALEYAHRKCDPDGRPYGIVHRDISLSNLLISREGTVKVLDFGIAKALDNSIQTPAFELLGKFRYMAPERLVSDVFDHRVDVFSLGVVLWELLLGRRLLPHKDQASLIADLLAGNFRSPSELDPRLPPTVDRVVMSTLATDPARRTVSAGALAGGLLALVHEISPGFDDAELARVLSTLMPEVWTSDAPPRPESLRWPTPSYDPTVPVAELTGKDGGVAPIVQPEPPRAPRRAHRVLAVLGVLALLGGGAALAAQFRRSPPATEQPPLPLTPSAAPAARTLSMAAAASPPPPLVVPPRTRPPPCAACPALALRALDAVLPPVQRCMRGQHLSVAATIEFDNTTGRVTATALRNERGAALPEPLQACMSAAVAAAHFTAPPSGAGVTRVARMWRPRATIGPKGGP